MSDIQISETSGKITGVTFYYNFLRKAKKDDYNPEQPKYTVEFAVDKKTAKAFKKAFAKNGVREIDNDDFKYGDLPYPEQDEQFLITLKAKSKMVADAPKAGVSKGDDIPYGFSTRPKVYVPEGDGQVKDVTMDVLVGHGSKGDVAFSVREVKEVGRFPTLTGILVTDMIEVERRAVVSNPFGEVVNEPAVEETPTSSGSDDDFDEDIPF